MKAESKIFILLILLLSAVSVSAKNSDPEINLSADLKSLSETSYSIDFRISISGIDTSIFMNEKINYPYHDLIVEGMIIEGRISEKDFLYSERNIDLNGDGDTEDTFNFDYKNGTVVVAGRSSRQLFTKSNGTCVLIPFDSAKRENILKLKPEGHPFVIHSYDPLIGRIRAGINDNSQKPVFKEFPNSLLIIELIKNDDGEPAAVTFNGMKAESGFTNERDFSFGGENLLRLYSGISTSLDSNTASDSIRIDNIPGSFKVRLRYLFAVSSRTVLMKEKILINNKK